MRCTHDTATDGRLLIRVVFERELPDADAPVVEVVYSLHYPENFRLDNEHAKVLILVSTTRRDTREAVTLDSEELEAAHEAATEHVAELTPDSFS